MEIRPNSEIIRWRLQEQMRFIEIKERSLNTNLRDISRLKKNKIIKTSL